MIALLAREAFEMINIGSGPHDHFEGRNYFAAGSTVSSISKKSVEREKFLFLG